MYTYKRLVNFNIPENMWLKFVVEFLLKEINSIDKEIILKIKMRHLNAICNIVMKLKNKITKYNLKQSKKYKYN